MINSGKTERKEFYITVGRSLLQALYFELNSFFPEQSFLVRSV